MADAVRACDGTLAVLVLAGTAAAEVLGGRGLWVAGESFADRAYTPQARLVSRPFAAVP